MKYDLDERLINDSVLILDIVDGMPDNRGANHLASQLVRSGTAPALMYGEAQAAGSRRDFIHKLKLPLKELRETSIVSELFPGKVTVPLKNWPRL